MKCLTVQSVLDYAICFKCAYTRIVIMHCTSFRAQPFEKPYNLLSIKSKYKVSLSDRSIFQKIPTATFLEMLHC